MSAAAAASAWLDRTFGVSAAGSAVGTELRAGLTTFVTMAYIVVVNPEILAAGGVPFDTAVFATCVSAAIGTLLMAWWARYPFALAPGMGINAYFSFSVVPAIVAGGTEPDQAWRIALGLVGWAGLLFVLTAAVQLRARIMTAVPASLKIAVSAGIGLFIALIGLQRSGVSVVDPQTGVALGDVRTLPVLLAGAGLLFTGGLMARRVRGALLWGVAVTTLAAILVGAAEPPAGWVALPRPRGLLQWDLVGALDWRYVEVMVAFLFVDLFDTVGTLLGVAVQGRFLDDRGELPRANRALAADAVATVFGAGLGTSTVTTYIESAAGVADGARTGLANLVPAVGFVAAMFFVPLLAIVPPFATAPALVAVGALMAAGLGRLDWSRHGEALAAFVTALAIPATYSIADGIALGVLTWVGVALIAGRSRDVPVTLWVLGAIFVARYTLLPS